MNPLHAPSTPQRRLKIGLLTTEYPGYKTSGGLGSVVRQLGLGLVGLGHEVSILVHGHPGFAQSQDGPLQLVPADATGLSSRIPSPLGRGSSIATAWKLRQIIRDRKLDVLEAPECSGVTAFLSFMRPSAKVVVRLHAAAAIVRKVDREPQSRYGNWLERRAMETADAVIANSHATIERTKEELRIRRDDFHVIPNPVSSEFFHRSGVLTQYPTIVFSGRLQWLKGIDVLVRAWTKIAARHPRARLVVIGEDTSTSPDGTSLQAYLNTLAGDSLNSIEFTGYLEVSDLKARLEQSWCAAFPARWEGFGLACAEAMALGLPVVVSDIAALKDLVSDGEAGRIIPLEDADALSNALLQLIEQPQLREKLSVAARKKASEFQQERVAAATAALYQQLLAGSSL